MKLPFLFLLAFSLNQGFSQVYHSIYTPMDIALNESNYSNFYTYEDDHKNGMLMESIFFKQMADSIFKNKTKWYKTDEGRAYIVSGALIGLRLYAYKDEDSFKK